MVGRLLGGISTSLLFSVFDAWLIRSHADADLPKSYLSKSFSWASYGNSVVAILAGLVANNAAKWADMYAVGGKDSQFHMGGFLNPFDLALVALVLCGTFAALLWKENYGEQSTIDGKDFNTDTKDDDDNRLHQKNWYDGLRNALTTTLRNRDIFLCGIVSSLFEGSMYIFVFMWTPLLKAFSKARGEDVELPFGIIFATFMVCCMAGSSCFSILVKDHPVEKLGVVVFGVGSFAMGLVALAPNETISFLGMNIFEICVGMYFPIMGTMKGGIVPEDKRAAIYNLYRIPLNFIVLFSLLTGLSPFISFTLNALMLGTATFLQLILMKRRLENTGTLENRVTRLEDEMMKEETASLTIHAEAV
jgi:MFS transporter, MFS domain-containing protein family, molybdate-anion transporter